MKQITLQEAVRNKLNKKIDFLRLDSYDQRLVLKYLKENSINLKVIGKRWFDVLKQAFFVDFFTYVDYEEGDIKSIKQFDTFDDFFKFVDGDIYSHSCFYGYNFNKNTVNRYNINLKGLNVKSFIKETINRYSFDSVKEKKEIKVKPARERAKEMMEWIDSCPSFKTVKELKINKYAFLQIFRFFEANEIYFSTLLRKKKNSIKEVIVNFICEEGTTFGFSIDDILIHYGRDTAQRVVDNYVGQQSYNTRRKRIREFNKVLEGYDYGPNELDRKVYFNEDLQLYIVFDEYKNGDLSSVLERYFFYSLDELAEFLKKDLCGADLSKAPATIEEIKQYKTNEKPYSLPLKYMKNTQLSKDMTGTIFTQFKNGLIQIKN